MTPPFKPATVEAKRVLVFAVGQVGRRLVHEIYKKPRHAAYTIARIGFDGTMSSLERGAKTLRDTKLISQNILRSQRYEQVEFERA